MTELIRRDVLHFLRYRGTSEMPMEGRRDSPQSALGVEEWLGIAEEGFSNCIEEGARNERTALYRVAGNFRRKKFVFSEIKSKGVGALSESRDLNQV